MNFSFILLVASIENTAFNMNGVLQNKFKRQFTYSIKGVEKIVLRKMYRCSNKYVLSF